MTDTASYQLGYSDAKAGKASAYPVVPAPVTPTVVAPATPAPKPAATTPITVAPQVLDGWIAQANAGDAAMIARLAALPGGPSVVYQLLTTCAPKNPLFKGIKAIGGARLIPVAPTDSGKLMPTFDFWTPFLIDGFTVKDPYGIFAQARVDGCCVSDCTLGAGTGAIRTTGATPAHHNTGGTNFVVRNLVMTAQTVASVIYADRDGFQLIDCTSLGSTTENGVRFDSPTADELPSITVTGGVFSTMNNFGKSTMTFRTAIATVTGAKFGGIAPAVGAGETYLPGDPLLPNPIGLLVPGYFANVTFDSCEWDGMDPDNNKAVPYISANEGTITLVRNCNFKSIGPSPHRLPVSTRVTTPPFPAEIARTTLINCTGNAPSVGAVGGKSGSLLPANHPGATESGSRWF